MPKYDYHSARQGVIALFLLLATTGLQGCFFIEDSIFPIWEENYFESPPVEYGPFAVHERRVEIADGADGLPFGITVFEPVNATGPLPVFVWVMGSNVQAYYHQSLHETLATWGYLVLVPDTRPLRFLDTQYHERIVSLAEQSLDLALSGALGPAVDETRIGAGGYSVGGPLAAYLAARRPVIDRLVHWAPSPSPIWQGLDPNELYPLVTQPSLYILGSRDDDAPPAGGFPDELQIRTPNAPSEVLVIEGATHHQFQQPTGADEFSNEPGIKRIEQQRIAITATLEWLDETG